MRHNPLVIQFCSRFFNVNSIIPPLIIWITCRKKKNKFLALKMNLRQIVYRSFAKYVSAQNAFGNPFEHFPSTMHGAFGNPIPQGPCIMQVVTVS